MYCLNVPIARTGVQEYSSAEIGIEGESRVVKVHRVEDEVFSPVAMASFEGMPTTMDHPSEPVGANNIMAYAKGHVQNVRRGSGEFADCVVADLVITHDDLIDAVLNGGLREVSCGYECEYREAPDGKVYQTAIRGNHVAVVDRGRAGGRVAIRDKAPSVVLAGVGNGEEKHIKEGGSEPKMNVNTKKASIIGRMFASFARDQAVPPEDVAEAADELMSGAEKEVPDVKDQEQTKEEEKMPVDKKRGCDQEMAPEKPTNVEVEKEAVVQDEGGSQLLALIADLTKEVMALKEMVTAKPAAGDEFVIGEGEKEPDMLDELEKEVSEPSEPMNESEVLADPEEIEVEDEEGFEEEVSEPSEETKEAVVAAIQELKPIIAELPVADRKRASDAMSRAIRKAAGMAPVSSAKDKARLARAAVKRRVAADSKKREDQAEIGKRLMEKFNPHYRKQ